MGKRFFSISFDIDTIAYGVHAALKAAVIMITIRVTFLSLRATISAILPVAFNELWKCVVLLSFYRYHIRPCIGYLLSPFQFIYLTYLLMNSQYLDGGKYDEDVRRNESNNEYVHDI